MVAITNRLFTMVKLLFATVNGPILYGQHFPWTLYHGESPWIHQKEQESPKTFTEVNSLVLQVTQDEMTNCEENFEISR